MIRLSAIYPHGVRVLNRELCGWERAVDVIGRNRNEPRVEPIRRQFARVLKRGLGGGVIALLEHESHGIAWNGTLHGLGVELQDSRTTDSYREIFAEDIGER
jgi:hypothetical protein